MSPSNAAQDLREVLGTPVSITVGGKSLSVRGLRLEELPIVIELFTPLAQDAFSQMVDIGLWLQTTDLVKPGERIRVDGAFLTKALARCLPLLSSLPTGIRAAQKISAICTDQAEEWVGKLDADEGIRLIERVLEVNADFFTRKVWPVVRSWLSRTTGPSSIRKASPAATAPAPSSTPSNA